MHEKKKARRRKGNFSYEKRDKKQINQPKTNYSLSPDF